jgi:hypothetical protein
LQGDQAVSLAMLGGGRLASRPLGSLASMWVPKPDNLTPNADQTLEELLSALLVLLDRIDDLVSGLPVKLVGRNHNHSPEGLVELEGLPDQFLPMTADDRDTALRATADVRLVLASAGHSALALSVAWQVVPTALDQLGGAVTSQVRMLYADGPTATILRMGMAGLAISLVAMELNLVNQTGAAGIIVAAIGAKMLSKKP